MQWKTWLRRRPKRAADLLAVCSRRFFCCFLDVPKKRCVFVWRKLGGSSAHLRCGYPILGRGSEEKSKRKANDPLPVLLLFWGFLVFGLRKPFRKCVEHFFLSFFKQIQALYSKVTFMMFVLTAMSSVETTGIISH